MDSLLFKKNIKAQITAILIRGDNKTAKQLFQELKKQNIDVTLRSLYKALSFLVEQKIIIKYETNYEINPSWISQFSNDANKALRNLLEKNLLGIDAKHLQYPCACGKANTQGFCQICTELACEHCATEQLQHNLCEANCLNCQSGHAKGTCSKCNKRACLGCAKTLWLHEHIFSEQKNNEMNIAILEVDHQCWFSNTSEKNPEEILLNSFSDKKDYQTNTHSGIVKIETTNKKIINTINKQEIIKEARLIHKQGNTYYIRTRADINKSVDEFTKNNNSILLNPVIAIDSKEQNLIIAPSSKEMKAMSKGLQEFGGKVKLLSIETFNPNKLNEINNKHINEFLSKVPKKELIDTLQKCKLMHSL